jgi:threonyl-tRNA synthetase
MAPEQVRVLPLTEKQMEAAEGVVEELRKRDYRVTLDRRSEKVGAKIRDAQVQKVPYMVVLGGREVEAGTVSIRHRTRGDLGVKPLAELIDLLRREVDTRGTEQI